MHNARIHFLYLGKNWQTSGRDVIDAEQSLVTSMNSSPWIEVLRKYHDAHGAAAQTVTLVTTTVDPVIAPQVLGWDFYDQEIAKMAHLISPGGLGPDDVVVLLPQAGVTTDDGDCGHHWNDITRTGGDFAFAVVRFVTPGDLCAPRAADLGAARNAMLVMLSHELAELFVNPDFDAWQAPQLPQLGRNLELVDACMNAGVDDIRGYLMAPEGPRPFVFDAGRGVCAIAPAANAHIPL